MVKFLIIRFSSIGDIVLTSPVIRCLKEQIEDAEIHFLTKEKFKDVIKHNPHISKVHLLTKDFNSLINELRDESFDFVIDLHHNLRSARVKNNLKRVAFSFNKLNVEKWLIVNFKVNKLPLVHIVDRYMQTLQLFDVLNDQKGLDYFIAENEEINLNELPLGFQKGFALFSIGGQHFTKKMPPQQISEIITKSQVPFILTGGPEDFEMGELIRSKCGDNVWNVCGKYSINQSASLVKQCRVLVSHDTGLMHIGAAFKKNIVSIWGNTIPEFGMYPYLAGEYSRIFEVKPLKCRPCSKLGFVKCPKKHFKCMNNQKTEEIAIYIKTIFYV